MGRAMVIINTDADREKCISWARKAPWGTRVEWKASKRSLPQNDRLWAMLTDVAAHMKPTGKDFTTEEWKLLFMHAWGREIRFLPGLDHKTVVPVGQSSSDLSKQEMTDLIEFIYAWGAENGVTFNEPADVSSIGGQGSDDAPSPDPSVVAADQHEAGNPVSQSEAGTIEADHPDTAVPASDLITPADRDWLNLVAKMLWAATGVGEQDVLKNQMAGIREHHTPPTVGDQARAKANSINTKCKLVCFGEASAADVLPLIAGIAGCDVKDIT